MSIVTLISNAMVIAGAALILIGVIGLALTQAEDGPAEKVEADDNGEP